MSFGVCANACKESDGPWRAELRDLLTGKVRKVIARTEPMPEPSMLEMGANLAAALVKWTASGFPVADQGSLAQRRKKCLACLHWDAKARGGFGKCAKCGCASLKWFLATEKCPVGHW